MNAFLTGFIVGTLVAAGVGVYLYNKKKSCLNCDVANNKLSGEDNANEIFIWLQDVLAIFKKKYIGYLIERLRLKNHFTHDQIKELVFKYGEVNAAPSLIIHEPFSKKFSDWDKLELAEKKWLSQKNVNFAGETRLHDKIENVLIAEAKTESPKFFAEFCEKKCLNVTILE